MKIECSKAKKEATTKTITVPCAEAAEESPRTTKLDVCARENVTCIGLLDLIREQGCSY
jgi:hypothetical protein